MISRSLPLFDRIIVAIGRNTQKQTFFTIDQRLKMISRLYDKEPKVSVDVFDGLTVDYCRRAGASYLLRGLRTAADFEYERAIAQINRKMNPDVETVFLLTVPEFTPINSTIIREILRFGGDVRQFLPDNMVIE